MSRTHTSWATTCAGVRGRLAQWAQARIPALGRPPADCRTARRGGTANGSVGGLAPQDERQRPPPSVVVRRRATTDDDGRRRTTTGGDRRTTTNDEERRRATTSNEQRPTSNERRTPAEPPKSDCGPRGGQRLLTQARHSGTISEAWCGKLRCAKGTLSEAAGRQAPPCRWLPAGRCLVQDGESLRSAVAVWVGQEHLVICGLGRNAARNGTLTRGCRRARAREPARARKDIGCAAAALPSSGPFATLRLSTLASSRPRAASLAEHRRIGLSSSN